MYTGSSFEKTISRTNTHQYLVKKYGNKSGDQNFNFEEIIQQIQDVFCIICEQYIPTLQIDRHSSQCNGQQDQIEQIDSIQQKLQKCNLLINRIKKMLKSYSSDQQIIIQYLQMLWKCVNEITFTVDVNQITQLIQDLDLFLQYFENQQQDPYIEQLISQILTILSKISQFSDRKHKILQQNQINVINHLKDSIATSLAQESSLNNKLVIHDSGLSRYRNPFENVQNNIHQSLRNTFSSRQVPQKQQKPYLSPINETSQIANLSPRLEQSVQLSSFISQKQVVERKNQFFKIASQLKKNFPQKKNVQQALIIALYDQADKQNIDSQQYEDYIFNLYQSM